jgi:hypothetical protein
MAQVLLLLDMPYNKKNKYLLQAEALPSSRFKYKIMLE